MPEKAIETYEDLLKLEEEVLKNEREIALTLANLAVNYDEIGETEKAIELMEKAGGEIFERLGDDKNRLISLLDLAHFKYELGDYDAAGKLIGGEVLRNPRDDEIEVNAKLVEAEISAGKEDYGKAFRAMRDALLKAINVNDEIFDLVFETLVDFIEGLFNEGGAYETVAGNVETLRSSSRTILPTSSGRLESWRAGRAGGMRKRRSASKSSTPGWRTRTSARPSTSGRGRS